MSIKCGAYVRPNNFQPPSNRGGFDAFFKTEAWPYWSNAERVKLEVGLYFDAAQRILSADQYSYFYSKFQKMRADFDKEWVTVKGYSDTATFWCKYITRGIQWDTQFRALRQEMKNSIQTAEQKARYEAQSAAATTAATSSTTASTKPAADAAPAEKKEAETKAKAAVKKESTPAKKKGRKKKTEAAVEAAGGNTEVAAQALVKSGEPAGTVSSISPLDIALWVGGGVLALGILWTFLPQTKPAVVEKVLDKVLPTPGTATAGLGSFGRYRRHRRR